MISWIIGILLIVWCVVKRFSKDGKVEGYPLSMPRGTVRALITLMIVSFPFNYLITGAEIPGIITNAIFILVAFYFEARKGTQDKLKLIKEIKDPEKYKEMTKKEKKPLYLPKYSVRLLLVTLLTSIIIINFIGPNVPFETTNTLLDILIIIVLYFVGTFFKSIGNFIERKKFKEKIINISDYQSISKYKILDDITGEKPSWWKVKGKSFLSLLTFIAITTALVCYTIEWDYTTIIFLFYEFSLRETLLLLINVYYGFRD